MQIEFSEIEKNTLAENIEFLKRVCFNRQKTRKNVLPKRKRD